MAGAAPSIDSNNNLYVITSNGDYNGSGRRIWRLFCKGSIPVLLYKIGFYPQDQALMESGIRLGRRRRRGARRFAQCAGKTSSDRRRKIGSGQAGELYVMNRDAMGQLKAQAGPPLVQKFPVLRHIFATPAFWNNTLYIAGKAGRVNAYALIRLLLCSIHASFVSAVLFNAEAATPSVSSMDPHANKCLWIPFEEKRGSGASAVKKYGRIRNWRGIGNRAVVGFRA